MDEATTTLIAALVDGYRPYTTGRLAQRGWEVPDAALAEGEAWLRDELTALLQRPYPDQARGPLEVFQEALAFPTRELAGAGIEPPARDPAAVAALPGDVYGLAPASSAEIGEEAWAAHLAWGAAKAAALAPQVVGAVRPPAVLLVARGLMDRSRIEAVVSQAGFRLLAWEPGREWPQSRPACAFVDLEHSAADEALRRLARERVRTVAYGPHVDDDAMLRARRLGAADAIARSRFFRTVADYLPDLA